jgi:hypothetical protein
MAPESEVPAESTAVILARMEVKLDHALANVTDHESRIRVLERKVWIATGVAGGVGGGLGALIAAITKTLGS